MKLSVSLSADEVAIVDAYAAASGLPSRSAVLQRAIQVLRYASLDGDYAAAWDEWVTSGERDVWEPTAGDGMADAPR